MWDAEKDDDVAFNRRLDNIVREIGDRGKVLLQRPPAEAVPPEPAPAPAPKRAPAAAPAPASPTVSDHSFTPSLAPPATPAAALAPASAAPAVAAAPHEGGGRREIQTSGGNNGSSGNVRDITSVLELLELMESKFKTQQEETAQLRAELLEARLREQALEHRLEQAIQSARQAEARVRSEDRDAAAEPARCGAARG
jgi:hypothetical protein